MSRFRLTDSIGMVLNRECAYVLGHLVYCKVDYLRDGKFKVDFFISKWNERRLDKSQEDFYLLSKELKVVFPYFEIDFPTKKKLEKRIKELEEEMEVKK